MPYLASARRFLPSVQVSTLISGSITLASAIVPFRSSIAYINLTTSSNNFTKFDNISETSTALLATGTTMTGGSCRTSNSGVAGYRLGWGSGDIVAYKMPYTTDVVSTLANVLPQQRHSGQGFRNTGTAGYGVGGANAGFATRYRTVVKMPFSTEAFATLGSSWTQMGNANATASDHQVAGYTMGGYSDTIGTIDDINKLLFSTDTFSSDIASLFLVLHAITAVSNDGTAAYLTGDSGSIILTIHKFSYSTATISTTKMEHSHGTRDLQASEVYQVSGLFFGGSQSPTTGISRIKYATETRTQLTPTISSMANGCFGDWTNNGTY